MSTKHPSKKEKKTTSIELPIKLLEKVFIPSYITTQFKQKQRLKAQLSEKTAKENYDNFVRELFDLDERCSFTYIWNDSNKTYSKVLWKTMWEEREKKVQKESELRWQEIMNRIENRILDKLENEKPWLFEEAKDDMEKRNIMIRHFDE